MYEHTGRNAEEDQFSLGENMLISNYTSTIPEIGKIIRYMSQPINM